MEYNLHDLNSCLDGIYLYKKNQQRTQIEGSQ